MGGIERVLALARAGDVTEAIALLEKQRSDAGLHDAERSLLFQLLSSKERFREAIGVADEALTEVATRELRPFARSNWLLRRGLLHIELKARNAALADLLAVQQLKANEGHLEQARAALLRVASLRST